MPRNALLNALQAASNEAAGTISGPVDLLSWGLRKAGVPVPTNALLSSEWMKQKGLLGDVQQGPSQVAGATLGLLSPIAAAAKAPQIARGLLAGEEATKRVAYAVGEKGNDMAQAYMARQGLMKPATVWHGSPHKFDKFDSSKIGTGEGAQAYGHGLYLAESPEVAGAYQKALSSGKVTAPTPANEAERSVLEVAQYRAQQLGGDLTQGLQHMVRNTADPQQLGVIQDLMNRTGKDGGALYKVDLPDETIARMLDWDKPLSQQPAVLREAFPSSIKEAVMLDRQRRALMKQAEELGDSAPEKVRTLRAAAHELKARQVAVGKSEVMTGQDLYGALMNTLGDKGGNLAVVGMPSAPQLNGPAAAQLLRKLGVPGSRHLDGASRSAGSGTSNFVVFPGEENALTILERNGLLSPR